MADESNSTTPPHIGEIDVGSVLLAGIGAGVMFLIVEIALSPLVATGMWELLQMRAAVLMGPEVMAPATIGGGAVVVGLVVHFVLALIYTFALAGIIHGQSPAVGTGIGLGFGLLLYGVNFYLFSGLFAWFVEARHGVSIAAHLVFGATAALLYVRSEVVLPKRRELGEQPA